MKTFKQRMALLLAFVLLSACVPLGALSLALLSSRRAMAGIAFGATTANG